MVAAPDRNGRWKPEKDKSAEKIDGISATVMAIGAQIRERPKALPAPDTAKAVGQDRGDDFFRPTGRLNI